MARIRRLLVANRGEIATRVFRACTELGIGTLAIYSHEDRYALHRFKADEAYEVGAGKSPVDAYLDIDDIIRIAKERNADAIHPGYGFLSENPAFAQACLDAGLIFVGPTPEQLARFGDKIQARRLAVEAGIPTIPGTDEPIADLEAARKTAEAIGFPLLVKAAGGGGGRGIRVVERAEDFDDAVRLAQAEAGMAFGYGAVYLEKLIKPAKHIEVQILADSYGNIVHLFERDCSVQRRHQKLIEVAPAVNLPEDRRRALCEAAVQLMRHAGYQGAGTVEFLVDRDYNFYFLEVNPRIQVEHTITELITQVDLVQAQILVADGYRLSDPPLNIADQASIKRRGFAIQCRITTEDPKQGFAPDTGRILTYRAPGGFGVRIDEGNGATGATISPYYDSLLVKVSTWADRFDVSADKMRRALREFRVRGVRTNVGFLEQVIEHPTFRAGEATTSFVDEEPSLLQYPEPRDRATRLLRFIAEVTVNGSDALPAQTTPPKRPPSERGAGREQATDEAAQRERHGRWRRVLLDHGPKAVADAVLKETKLLLTDTTYRDAHQSLLATRMRTYDLVQAMRRSPYLDDVFSVEAWGGATFDTALRFLKESPWHRLQLMRDARPDVLFQLLFRASNAVGYANYPDNVVRTLIHEAAARGIDVFRIFDCFNNIENMKFAIEAGLETGQIIEGAICYTGDLTSPDENRFTLDYYVALAEELEREGVHFIGIKDMAGLLKPQAARVLVETLKKTVRLPIHLHTHDTTGNGVATLLAAAEAGVDVVDAAIASMSGLTSQPSLNAIVAALDASPRNPQIDLRELDDASRHWEQVRAVYQPFESDLRAPTTEVYFHEMPGGQYSNLRAQAAAVGLGARWPEIVQAYRDVDTLVGRIVKVTPTSKAIGDMALFLVQQDLSIDALSEETLATEEGWTAASQLQFPQSFKQLLSGEMGLPREPFPPLLQKLVLKGEKPLTQRAGAIMPPVDLDALQKEWSARAKRPLSRADVIAGVLYEQAFWDWLDHLQRYGDTSVLDTWTFFYGAKPGDEIEVELEPGKTLFLRLLDVGAPDRDGRRIVQFEVNGLPRSISVIDRSLDVGGVERAKASPLEPEQLGAPMSGKVQSVAVEKGDSVTAGDTILVLEAMKMQINVRAPHDGVITALTVQAGDDVAHGDLLAIVRRQAEEEPVDVETP